MFSIRLKGLREEKGLSQQAFANKFGISQSTIGMWESGKREPNFTTIQKIAEFFNVSIDYLLCRTDTPKPSSLDEQLSGVDFALWSEAKDMTDSEKQDIINYMKFKKTQRNE